MMEKDEPLISVIIPTYDREFFLKQTIESVVGQTYSNIEIIVVDDGTPNTRTEDVCKQFPEVTYLRIPNSGGPATPRNVGLRYANADFIALVDDDDLWVSTKLEKQLELLVANPDFGLVHGPCKLIDEMNTPIEGVIGRPGSMDVKHGDVRNRMMGNWTLMMPTPLIRKEVIQAVGFFNEEIPPALEDVEYWNRCAFHTKFYYFDTPLVTYRKHSNNISSDRKKYLDLPLYLKAVLQEKRKAQLIGQEGYVDAMNRLCYMQIKMLRYGYLKTIRNLGAINSFWFFNFRALKLFAKNIR